MTQRVITDDCSSPERGLAVTHHSINTLHSRPSQVHDIDSDDR